ncbi:MAG: glutathione peroxidase [Chitinophagaceae bacterium]|nr:glutathione peroxidase [Chitinophagaceae bacterium]
MTVKQQLLKAVYPVWMSITKMLGMNVRTVTNDKTAPLVPFHSLMTQLNTGKDLDFSELKGKKVLIVNTASNCGYTNQYDDLQKLYGQFESKLVILGFPANDFKEQEKGSDEDIAQFCKINFGVTFPLMRKSVVVKNPQQNPVFKWLTNAASNGWNNKQPSWNFSKYLISEQGHLTNYFDPSVSPVSSEVIDAIKGK